MWMKDVRKKMIEERRKGRIKRSVKKDKDLTVLEEGGKERTVKKDKEKGKEVKDQTASLLDHVQLAYW